MKGKFIVIEGIDNAGKGTQSALLAEHLRSKGFKVLLTKEPTNGILGGISKAALNKELTLSNKALQLLFCADRAHHLDTEIEPAMQDGFIVLCDRYFFSMLPKSCRPSTCFTDLDKEVFGSKSRYIPRSGFLKLILTERSHL